MLSLQGNRLRAGHMKLPRLLAMIAALVTAHTAPVTNSGTVRARLCAKCATINCSREPSAMTKVAIKAIRKPSI